jgi:RNA polymerase sigma-70 factor, ECF subfamily
MEQVTDGELVELARGGDTAAFGDLVSRHKLTVYRAALAALGSPADAEDVAQEAFILAFQNLGAFRGEASVKTWMVRIAWRLALTRRRGLIKYVRRTLRIDAGAPETIQSPEPSAEVQLGDAETVARVRQLIRALPSRLRDPLLLSMNPDMTSDEIAAVLGVPPGTVRWRLMEARRQLRQRLTHVGVTSLR